jgi:hypothetical protein
MVMRKLRVRIDAGDACLVVLLSMAGAIIDRPDPLGRALRARHNAIAV